MIPDVADLVGVQYRRMGDSATIGLDCWGLVREVYRRAGCDIPQADDFMLWAHFDEVAHWRDLPLAVLGFQPDGKHVTHLAVYLGHGICIHADDGMGCVVLCPVSDIRFPVAVAFVPCTKA